MSSREAGGVGAGWLSAAELSLTVPITNSLAFLFTVLGEWCADGTTITRGKCCSRERNGDIV